MFPGSACNPLTMIMDSPTKTLRRQRSGARNRRRKRLFVHETSSLLRLAGPIIVSQLGQVGMNTADTIMVGPLGATSLAATGLGSAIHFLGVVFSMGVVVGLAPIVSQAFGRGDLTGCRRALMQGIWVGLLLAVPVVLMNLGGGGIARVLGQGEDVAELAGGYMRALAWGVPPFFVFFALRQYLESMNRPTAPMVVTFIGLAVNIIANRVFIYGIDGLVPAMGVVGTGHATSVVRWAMLIALAGWVWTRPLLRPFGGDIHPRPDAALIRLIVRIGAPIGGQFALEVGCFSFAAVMMGWLGPVDLAAHQVTINIASTTFMVALGASLAGSVRVGQHIGAHRPRAMRRAVLATYVVAIGFMALCALIFLALPRELIGLYTSDPSLIELGARLLLVAAAFQVFDGAQVAGMSVLRGAADTRTPMLIAGLGYWGFGVPVGYLLAFLADLGAIGVWAGLSAGLGVVALLLAVRVRRALWRADFETLKAGS
jgi:multidrug resistance protein, MATE family